LVIWNMFFIFPYIGNVIIPTDFHIFQRGWKHQPVSFANFSWRLCCQVTMQWPLWGRDHLSQWMVFEVLRGWRAPQH
jgi:hypothetical protein